MNWSIDKSHTSIEFVVTHMMISKVKGHFEEFEGEVKLDKENPENTTVEARIKTASINTREPKRDAHLRSADFFDSEKYPEMVFRSRRIIRTDDLHARLLGELTIRDITRDVELNVEYTGEVKSPWGTTSAGFMASATISRKDWNLTWNQMLESGGMLVGDDIKINIELELVQTPEVESASAQA